MNLPLSQACRTFHRTRQFLAAGLIFAAVAGCSSVDVVRTSYVPLDVSTKAAKIQLSRAVVVALSNESTITLPANSQWLQTGAVPQGDVYRQASGTLTLQGRRVREAYLVISGGVLTGLYFPGEVIYSPVSQRPRLAMEKI